MKRVRLLAAVFAAILIVPSAALAHHPDRAGGREDFPGEGVVDGMQHGTSEGHLPAVNENVELVGKAEVTNPSGAGNDGRVADVFGYGDYAYLTAFREPTCVQAGVHVIDIHDPANPFEVTSAFIPTSVGNYAGEGIQVIPMNNAFFTGDLLIHQNETCPFGPAPVQPNVGGISMWDVSDPTSPVAVKLHAGDLAGGLSPSANQTHSMYAWTNQKDTRTYVSLIDDEELTDIDILDITDPFNPVLVNDTLDLVELFGVDQATPANLRSEFSHDMHVQKMGQRYVMNVNYWDGGYVLLDVTDPRPGMVTLIAESDYAALDEERLARGHSISPEGNSHQSELSPNGKFLIGTDEDFNPYRVVATINSGPYAGTEYTATQANATPPIDADTAIVGTPTYVGFGCTANQPPPPGTGIALVERGICTFQEKLDNITAAGYTSGIVFQNVRLDCLAQVTMAASGSIPFVFANRLTGLQLLGVAGVTADNACATASPAPGSAVSSTTIEAVFDGWGYVRLFGTDIPRQNGKTGSITQIDTFTIPEAQDPAYAVGFGTLSVHEVAMDPNEGLAYLSYYAGGFRVVTYGNNGIQQVGAFIDAGGNDFWGVEIWHDENGEKFVLASDRDFGLYIFQYTGPTP
jgi:hypothetical protein